MRSRNCLLTKIKGCYKMLNMMDTIDRLEHFRLENQITQQELAKKLGVAFTTINRWLKRRVKPSQLQEYQIQKLLRKNNGTRKA